MQDLKADGFQFALDGFGLGMSSYTYVKKLPVDYLKIDGSLVKEIAKDPISRAMVAAINEIGHAIGLQTIAENVEDHKVIDTLREICVDYAQGFAIATPQALPGVGNLADFGTAKWPSGRPTTLVRPSSAMAIA
jgi:Amt family ammonium transporter